MSEIISKYIKKVIDMSMEFIDRYSERANHLNNNEKMIRLVNKETGPGIYIDNDGEVPVKRVLGEWPYDDLDHKVYEYETGLDMSMLILLKAYKEKKEGNETLYIDDFKRFYEGIISEMPDEDELINDLSYLGLRSLIETGKKKECLPGYGIVDTPSYEYIGCPDGCENLVEMFIERISEIDGTGSIEDIFNLYGSLGNKIPFLDKSNRFYQDTRN